MFPRLGDAFGSLLNDNEFYNPVEHKNTCKLTKFMFCLEAAEQFPENEEVHVLGSIAVLVGTIGICQKVPAAAQPIEWTQ